MQWCEQFPNRNRYLLVCIVLLGSVLRFYGIGSMWFGFDEQVSMVFAQSRHWPSLWRMLWLREMNMVGYYAILRVWLYLDFADCYKLAFARSLSALFSIASIPVLYAIGKKLFNERAGLLAAGLLAINAFHIKHAQNVRAYSLFAFLTTLAALLFINNLKNENPKWTAYLVLWSVAVYVHVFAFFFLAAHIVLMAYTRTRPSVRQLACLFVAVAPMAVWTATHSASHTGMLWVPPTTAWSVTEAFTELVGNDGVFLLFIAVGAMLPMLFKFVRKADASVALLLIWVLVPVLLTIAASWHQPCFVPRYLFPCMPALMLLIAASIERQKKLVAAVLLVLIVLGMLNGTRPIGA